jgi:predicted RNA-binding protein with TRAM domain
MHSHYSIDVTDIFWKFIGEGYDDMYKHTIYLPVKPNKLAIYNHTFGSHVYSRVSVPNFTKNDDGTFSYNMENLFSNCYVIFIQDAAPEDSVEITDISPELNEYIYKLCNNEELPINKSIKKALFELNKKYTLIGTYLSYEYLNYHFELTLNSDTLGRAPTRLSGLMAQPSDNPYAAASFKPNQSGFSNGSLDDD